MATVMRKISSLRGETLDVWNQQTPVPRVKMGRGQLIFAPFPWSWHLPGNIVSIPFPVWSKHLPEHSENLPLFSLKHLQDDILNIWALLRENYYWEICLQWIQNQNKKPKSRNICLSSWHRRKRESKGLKTALCDSGDCKCWTVLVHQSLLTRRVNTLCLHTPAV